MSRAHLQRSAKGTARGERTNGSAHPETSKRSLRISGMRDRDARLAGLLYLLAVIGGVFVLRYIPARVMRSGDAVATAHNIVANELLFRVGIAGGVALGVLWLFVVLALYRLLKDVDRVQAALMVILGAFLQVPTYFANTANYGAALLLVTDNRFSPAFSEMQRDVTAALFLQLHFYELNASLVLAGLWLMPFGILVYKSGFLPRVLGGWLILNGFAWLAISFTNFLAPQYGDIVESFSRPILFGEIAITLWMLVMGARTFGGRAMPRGATTA